MKSALSWLLLWLAFAPACFAQIQTRQTLATILGFENNTRAGAFPVGWTGNGGVTDDQVRHSGRYSARIDRTNSSTGTFSTLTVSVPLDFAGRAIEWRGFIKWENVNGAVALWLREDSASGSTVGFATLQGLNLAGTRDWTQYSVSVPVVTEGSSLTFGFLVAGTGRGWVDDLQLLVDGQPVAQAPSRVPTPFDKDHEFDQGSGIRITDLSDAQIQNLATLAKVWGFLKYHHPAVTAGQHHWDYELFRILPQVLAASDRVDANQAMFEWVGRFGEVQQCSPCASLNSADLYLGPDIEWIGDKALLGADLSQALKTSYQNRTLAIEQFYVGPAIGGSNLVFQDELSYGSLKLPDAGYQLLALFRYWNMVQYFYPDRDVMADDPLHSTEYWDSVLKDSIPRIAFATDSVGYQWELMRFIAKINDTHANLWSSLSVRPPIGPCQLPVDLRFVEGVPVVYRYYSPTSGPASGLLPGDVIEELDGLPVAAAVRDWTPLYADSNEAARLRDIARYMTRGSCGLASLVVRRGNTSFTVQTARVLSTSLDTSVAGTHDLPGDTFRMLTDDIAYLKLSSVVAAESANYVQAAAGSKGMIIDIRNYPSQFVVFTLGQLLVSQPTEFVRFTRGEVANPGAVRWLPRVGLTPQAPHYSGKIVILVDEITQSQAEYTTMAFRTAPGAIVIGSTTAGADGNVMTVMLPGGFSSYISGLGVFYPDHRPTQRVGIIPDVEVRPTIEGIRTGRDELIEEAIRQIHGPDTTHTISFSLPDNAAASSAGSGISSGVSVGYGVIQPDRGATPSALAIFGLRQKDVLVSEASVAASPLIRTGRTYVEIGTTTSTGLAIANPNSETAVISFFFSDSNGSFGSGTTSIPPRGHIAKFLNEAPFNGKSPLNGTITFTSTVPVAVVALRGLTNERGEFLITTLPVADLNVPTTSATLAFPHFADGGGWTTQIALSNPTDSVLSGAVQFVNPSGTTDRVFEYSIPARSSYQLQTSGTGTTTTVGSVRVIPAAGTFAPFGVAIFSFRKGGVTVSEAGVPSVPIGNAFRLYAEGSGDAASIQTGVAVTNASATSVAVTVELFNADGSSSGLSGKVSIPANGQIAAFLNQIPGFASLQMPFRGTLRVSSPASISVIGLRGRYNERSDFLITTVPPVNEATAASLTPLYLPHLAVGGGYTTQFIILSGLPGQSSSGTLSLFSQSGQLLNVILR